MLYITPFTTLVSTSIFIDEVDNEGTPGRTTIFGSSSLGALFSKGGSHEASRHSIRIRRKTEVMLLARGSYCCAVVFTVFDTFACA